MVVNEISKLKYNEITFCSVFKEYGVLRFLISTETIISIFILLILFFFKILPLHSIKINQILPVILTVSASIFAVEIAGFAVIATFNHLP